MVESKPQRCSHIGRSRLSRSPLVVLTGFASAVAMVSLVACGAVVGDAFDVKSADDASTPQDGTGDPEGPSRPSNDASNDVNVDPDGATQVRPSGRITYYQSEGAHDFDVPSTTISHDFPFPVAAAHTVIVALQTSASVASITDDHGNAYSLAAYAAAEGPQVVVYSALNLTDGPLTVTVNFKEAAQWVLAIHDYSGIDGVDQRSGKSGNGTAVDTGNIAIDDGNQLLFAFGRCNTGLQDAPSKDFVKRVFEAGNLSEDRIVSGAGTYTATFTAAGDTGGGGWTAVLASFKGAEKPSP